MDMMNDALNALTALETELLSCIRAGNRGKRASDRTDWMCRSDLGSSFQILDAIDSLLAKGLVEEKIGDYRAATPGLYFVGALFSEESDIRAR